MGRMLNNPEFEEITQLIERSKQTALRAVNTSLIELYWQVGAYISQKLSSAAWGEGVVDQLAAYLSRTQPGLRGFTRPNLFRMRQFYETYQDDVKVSPLVRQLPWTHNIIILSQCKRPEEREFYLIMAIRERWSKRELERQSRVALFERSVLDPPKASVALRESRPETLSLFKDAYMVEFLELPVEHSENELQQGLIARPGRLRQGLPETPRKRRNRNPALCQQRSGSRSIQPQPDPVASPGGRVSDKAAG